MNLPNDRCSLGDQQMLNSAEPLRGSRHNGRREFLNEASFEDWNAHKLFLIFVRQKKLILWAALACLLIASAYILFVAPKYTATTEILIDAPRLSAVADAYDTAVSPSGPDTGFIDSQVEILNSERIARNVIVQLKLKEEPSFQPKPIPLIGPLVALAESAMGSSSSSSQTNPDYALERSILKTLSKRLSVKRLARTFVLELKFSWEDPKLATRIANAFAEQYLAEQVDARSEAARSAANWLQTHIVELKEKSIAADLEVARYKAAHGLMTVNGTLVDEDQLAKANEQLSDARQRMAEAEAKYSRIDAIVRAGDVQTAVSEPLPNPVIAALRLKYAEASQRERIIAHKWGSAHGAADNARSQMKEYERLLFEELGRIGQTYKNDYMIAKAQLDSANRNLEELLSRATANDQVLAHLRELNGEADTYKALYRSNLNRYENTIQQLSFPNTSARVVAPATVPIEPTPKPIVILVGALVGGSFLGIGIGLAREMLEQGFRTEEQVTRDLGLNVLGMLPMMPNARGSDPAKPTAQGILPELPEKFRIALHSPLSAFAEALRAVKIAADSALAGRRPKIVGIVSTMEGEGKTLVSKNLATLLASLGVKTLLIDADLRRSQLSKLLSPSAPAGLIDMLEGTASLDEVIAVDLDSGLEFLPAPAGRQLAHAAELLSSPALRGMLGRLEARYEYVIIDLPPLEPVVDVRAAAGTFDAFVFIIEWGKTPRSRIKWTLSKDPALMAKCLGAVLNKVDMTQINSYNGMYYKRKESYLKSYS
jgi:succinoglycan biosynthesis transport protein ExoP